VNFEIDVLKKCVAIKIYNYLKNNNVQKFAIPQNGNGFVIESVDNSDIVDDVITENLDLKNVKNNTVQKFAGPQNGNGFVIEIVDTSDIENVLKSDIENVNNFVIENSDSENVDESSTMTFYTKSSKV
jgi:hypothetical protein